MVRSTLASLINEGVTVIETMAPLAVAPDADQTVTPAEVNVDTRTGLPGRAPASTAADMAHSRARAPATSASANAPPSPLDTVALVRNAAETL